MGRDFDEIGTGLRVPFGHELPGGHGVFHGASTLDGVPVAHPMQPHLDRDTQAERAPETAEQLRNAVKNRIPNERA